MAGSLLSSLLDFQVLVKGGDNYPRRGRVHLHQADSLTKNIAKKYPSQQHDEHHQMT